MGYSIPTDRAMKRSRELYGMGAYKVVISPISYDLEPCFVIGDKHVVLTPSTVDGVFKWYVTDDKDEMKIRATILRIKYNDAVQRLVDAQFEYENIEVSIDTIRGIMT